MPTDARTLLLHDDPRPLRWTVGEHEVEVVELTAGTVSDDGRLLEGAAGRATVTFPGVRAPRLRDDARTPANSVRLRQTVDVVGRVTSPQTQLGLADAVACDPSAAPGRPLTVDLVVDRRHLTDLVTVDLGELLGRARLIDLEFRDLVVDLAAGRVVKGTLQWEPGKLWRALEIDIDGFTIVIPRLVLSPKGSRAPATLVLPPGVADAGACGAASIGLGTIAISPTGDYFFDLPALDYGPWLIGDTGLVATGTGVVIDLSATQSAPGFPLLWRGLVLGAGEATGAAAVPDPCNTGYLRGRYTYARALLRAAGLDATLHLAESVSFTALNPLGQFVEFGTGSLVVQSSTIAAGQFQQATSVLVEDAGWGAGSRSAVRLPFGAVDVEPDLALSGVADGHQVDLHWGELTRHGDEIIPWRTTADLAYLYLPAGPFASYSPVASGAFVAPHVSRNPVTSLPELATHHASGVTFARFGNMKVFSPDGPTGVNRPYDLQEVEGWLRAGITGLDGQLFCHAAVNGDAGFPGRQGYVGNRTFRATLVFGQPTVPFAEFVTSAVHESTLDAYLTLPVPADLPRLHVLDIGITSTAHLVGGDLALPPGGVPLGYWEVKLVPTGPPAAAAVLSVRTGRILLTAAGIQEALHFARPFGLTWGELLADGNLGDLFLDFNDWGQRFDGLVFHHDALVLSTYAPGTDSFLGVSGQVLLPYFGLHYVNIRDAARITLGGTAPHPRHVTVPKPAIAPGSRTTDLSLARDWHDVHTSVLANFLCTDADVDYHVTAQNGFLGTGTAEFGFLHSSRLDITVEIHSDATDIRISAQTAHGLDIGPVSNVGSLGEIVGSARIEGSGLARITMYGAVEQSAGALFTNKVGYSAEANFTITPTSIDLYVSGDMLVGATVVEVEAAGTAHLFFDFGAGTAEGELSGCVDADAAIAGLSGDGQFTWHISPAMHYLQGRVRVAVFSTVASGGLEGGFFIGRTVPKALAWSLDTGDPHFRLSRAIMPATITGIYGYGRVSFGVNWYVFGGGVDIFAGAGAFSQPVPGFPAPPFVPAPQLPFVAAACGIHVHGEILGGLVSASAWANLSLVGGVPPFFEGSFELRGCVLWVMCSSVSVSAGVNSSGFYLY
ncbi:hypothetical protein [Phytohabitans aurantiacus]|uniref:Uncharacterized protein n=1 Tax=Phytohabitans aurantiacus TaxID=3016789 RepID=A0ABQ5R9E1_9ACTN|nr:hypothetical protein [Phytohabitans aurantiacus]GLI03376.1 hypothetical protein Pa4123_86540 [Phytohabitans aurantiacus]